MYQIEYNKELPTIMHIDMNSCFATAEQQANPFLRGRPVGVAAYTGENGCVISPSYEAKKFGVKVGFRVKDAKMLCPEIEIIPPDPPKYRDVHQRFSRIFKQYAPIVIPKSIDEAVLDFKGTEVLNKGIPGLIEVGKEIKYRIRKEIGEWVTCNIGISTNMFLAKTAASLHKPDGLDVITHENLREVFSTLELTDLCGIADRNAIRLKLAGIKIPLEFLDADYWKLRNEVFQSIVGHYWFAKLRGWEADKYEHRRKTFGQSFALHEWTGDIEVLKPLMMKLCEKMGRRVRRNKYYAQGIHVGCLYSNGKYWHIGRKSSMKLYTTQEFYERAVWHLSSVKHQPVTHLMVNCYNLMELDNNFQEELYDKNRLKCWELSRALDLINDRYGEYVAYPARMMGLADSIIDRIPFGGLGVAELEEMYEIESGYSLESEELPRDLHEIYVRDAMNGVLGSMYNNNHSRL